MICAKITPQGLFGSGEEDFFKGFYHIWAWQPSWSMDHDHFSNLSFPCPIQRRSRFLILNIFPVQMYGAHTKKMHREANDLAINRSNVNVQPLF